MKKRDVILDFTSLLDVTLIVIFFFVLFSTLESQQNKEKTEAAVAEFNMATQEAQEREEEYNTALDILNSSTEKENKEGIVEFNKGKNMKIFLNISDEEDSEHHKKWSIRISQGNDLLGEIDGGRNISEDIHKCINDAGYKKDDTILCDLIMDMNEPGSFHAFNELEDSIDKVKSQYYSHFYISETDLSVGGK